MVKWRSVHCFHHKTRSWVFDSNLDKSDASQLPSAESSCGTPRWIKRPYITRLNKINLFQCFKDVNGEGAQSTLNCEFYDLCSSTMKQVSVHCMPPQSIIEAVKLITPYQRHPFVFPLRSCSHCYFPTSSSNAQFNQVCQQSLCSIKWCFMKLDVGVVGDSPVLGSKKFKCRRQGMKYSECSTHLSHHTL